MSAHENCTHPKTKSARAACRRAAKKSNPAPTVKIEKPAAMTVAASADEERRIKTVIFESTECVRCGGSGEYGPKSVHGGVCFLCAGKKTQLTRKGKAAKKECDRLLDERLSVHVSELSEGDVIWASAQTWAGHMPADYPKRWRQIKSIEIGKCGNASIERDEDGNERRIPHTNIEIYFESNQGERRWQISTADISKYTFRRSNREETQRTMQEIVRRFSGATAVYYED